MDDLVMRTMKLASLALLVLTGPAAAQGLPDPTRPPAALLLPRPGGGWGEVASASGPQLQSVLIARHAGGRHVAVIDGQTLRLGDRYKGAVLSRMTENEVVLISGTSRQVLKLYPAPNAKK